MLQSEEGEEQKSENQEKWSLVGFTSGENPVKELNLDADFFRLKLLDITV
jgi:hypothetical protein